MARNIKTIKVKTTATLTVDIGDVPAGLIKAIFEEGGDGFSLVDSWTFGDLGNYEQAIDEVTVS